MSHNSGASSSSSSSSRFLNQIPNNVRKTIQHIKEITSNHSEEDIYAMLKECSMDPNETTQRLLHLDTFHEVKRKREKRKESLNSRLREEPKWKPGHQGRGTRSARGNPFSQHQQPTHDTGRRRTATLCKENGVEETGEKGFRHSPVLVSKEIKSVQPRNLEKLSSIITNGPLGLPSVSLSGGDGFISSKMGYSYITKENVGATADIVSIEPTTIAENASSASNPLLVLPCDSRASKAGTIKEEVCDQHMSSVMTSPQPADEGLDVTEFVSDGDLNQDEHDFDSSQVSSSTSEKQPYELVEVAHLKVSGECVVAENSQGVKDATTKLHNLKFSDGQHVIIPQHIQVPDSVKNVLTFGSLDARFEIKENSVNNESNEISDTAADSVQAETVSKFSTCDQDDVSTTSQANNADNSLLPLPLPVTYSPMDTNSSSIMVLNDDQPKQDNLTAVGPPFPVVQTTPSFNFGYMPPMLANVLSRPEGFESQAHVLNSLVGSSMTTAATSPPLTQSTGAGPSSVTVSPQPIPLFRQPYPPNYMPYNPYFSPFYVPPTMHQYFGHATFPPPLPTGGMYIPSPLAASGIKISPPSFKPGTNTGNQTTVGVPPGYGAYNISQAGFNQNASLAYGSSSNAEDIGTPALMENKIYPGQQLGLKKQKLDWLHCGCHCFMNRVKVQRFGFLQHQDETQRASSRALS
ncbi:GBF-interacting protein 1-like isoform X2 [Amaranthus tricolor]|uniref:GBF-interacting protein 1-like isoform X2 n=1 Tax=Amaranthus tricolor TaxID=29722 RepID=UPI002590E3A7|nr:GBF-interacting protein 1-like isoform X2 [Amaranthus tricolor]